MTERPSGTVTFLFTDIEGSTRLLHALGAERYAIALDQHRRILRSVFGRHHGHEVDTQGDAFLEAFQRAGDAVLAAAAAQLALSSHDWPGEGRPIRVRMGIHTTDATPTDEGYVGIGVHRGARIGSAAYGGQVLVSQTTRDLVVEEAGILFRDLGEHRLKDLAEPQRLYQLLAADLEETFPPLRTLENRSTNLPIQPTSMVGREAEVAEIAALLRRGEIRMVTLTGPGGTGKTRLALQAAAELVDEFSNGVFLVELAAVTVPDLLVPTIAASIGVNEAAGQHLAAYLATKQILLLVDNFEHLMSAARRLAELLGSAPSVKVLTTSREPLHLAAEHVYPVAPLGAPESVELFVERAQAAMPSFVLTAENAPTVAAICVRLDGLPLALELAAARIPLLSPESMLARLGERLKLLTAGVRDAPSRQQTLRDTMSWSHDLLQADERRLFARLGVFAGGFSLDAMETICQSDLDVLASLVDKSLVRRDGDRFAMLDTIREFAAGRLQQSGEATELAERHATYFEDMAEAAYRDRHVRGTEWGEQLEQEDDNLRAALDFAAATDPRRLLRLVGALGWFWRAHSKLAEGRAWLTSALGLVVGSSSDRARALSSAGQLAAWQGDILAARALLEEAISAWKAIGSEQEVALALHELGWGELFAGNDQAARRHMEESLDMQRRLGGPHLINRAQLGLLQMLVATHEVETVPRLGAEAVELSRSLGDVWSEHFAHHFLADCALLEDDYRLAQATYALSLSAAWRAADEIETSFEIQGLAMAACGLGRSERAVRLFAAADTRLGSLGVTSLPRFWRELRDRHLDQARVALGPAQADSAWEAGRRMGLDAAVAEALAIESTAG